MRLDGRDQTAGRRPRCFALTAGEEAMRVPLTWRCVDGAKVTVGGDGRIRAPFEDVEAEVSTDWPCGVFRRVQGCSQGTARRAECGVEETIWFGFGIEIGTFDLVI